MKIAFIFVLFKTPKSEIERLKKEIKGLRLPADRQELYFIDNSKNNRGYAAGVNQGIRKGLQDGANLFVIANPDISLPDCFSAESAGRNDGLPLLEAAGHFDIWGYAMRQNGNIYYGGEIDRWRMSGGLVEKKPSKRYIDVDFVSGSLMIIKRKVIEKIGDFDESYFMYYEDVDYCLRARQAGFKVGIDSQLTYKHFETSKNNQRKEQYLAQNRQRFFNRYGSLAQKIYERVRSHKFFFNFFSLNVSSFFIKFLSFVNFIFLIRFLKPSEYGIYSLVWAQVSLFSPLSDFGTTAYGIVNLPTQKASNFRPLLSLRFFLSIIIFLATIGLSFIFYQKNIRLILFIFLVSTAIFSNMASGSYFIWNAIREKIYISSRNSIIFNLVIYTTIISSLILWKKLEIIFLAIFIFYSLYAALNLWFIKNELGPLLIGIYRTDWAGILKKASVFVLIGFFAGLYFKLDVFLLKLLKSETEVGIYSAGYKFFEAFLFIAASYNVTATPIFARLTKNPVQFIQKIKKDLVLLFIIGMTIAVSTSIFAPAFLPFILKGNYLLAIKVTRIVMFTLPFILVNSVLINTLYVLGRAKFVILVFVSESLVNFALNITFIPYYSYIASAYITIISELVNLLILIILVQTVWIKTYENQS